MPLFVLFIVIPIIEIALFIQVGGLIGVGPTIALVILSAVVGSVLIRRQGREALRDVQKSFATLSDPTRPIAHGAMILLAGALMVTPGFFTDTVGLLLLIPAVRVWVMGRLAGRVRVVSAGFRPPQGGFAGGFTGPADVVEGEFTEVDPNPARAGAGDPRLPHAGDPPTKGPSGWTRH